MLKIFCLLIFRFLLSISFCLSLVSKFLCWCKDRPIYYIYNSKSINKHVILLTNCVSGSLILAPISPPFLLKERVYTYKTNLYKTSDWMNLFFLDGSLDLRFWIWVFFWLIPGDDLWDFLPISYVYDFRAVFFAWK